MQDIIKRYFWVLGGVVAVVCSVFAAKATSHIVEAKYLGDSEHPPKVVAVAPTPATPVKQVRSKEGGPLAARNIFCSECTPAVATTVGATEDYSYETVVTTENQRQGSYSVGDPIPGASGKLKVIHYKYIDFENAGHMERLVLLGATLPPPTPV